MPAAFGSRQQSGLFRIQEKNRSSNLVRNNPENPSAKFGIATSCREGMIHAGKRAMGILSKREHLAERLTVTDAKRSERGLKPEAPCELDPMSLSTQRASPGQVIFNRRAKC